MLDCKHASHLLSQSQERKLSWIEQGELRFHLLICDACRNFAGQLGLLRSAVRRLVNKTENDESVRMSEEARKRISQRLRSEE